MTGKRVRRIRRRYNQARRAERRGGGRDFSRWDRRQERVASYLRAQESMTWFWLTPLTE